MYKEEILSLVSSFTEEQLVTYIKELEIRTYETQLLVRELKNLKKKKFSHTRTNLDNGTRGGKG